MKITDEQIKTSCEVASAVHDGEMSTAQGVEMLVTQHLLNKAAGVRANQSIDADLLLGGFVCPPSAGHFPRYASS